MTNKKTPEYTFEDFMTEDNISKPTKLVLNVNDKPTKHYLMVSGAQSKSVLRERINWANKINSLNSKLEDNKDDLDRAVERTSMSDLISTEFALSLVTGWSFGDFDKDKLFRLFDQNQGLSKAVVDHAFAAEGVLQKK